MNRFGFVPGTFNTLPSTTEKYEGPITNDMRQMYRKFVGEDSYQKLQFGVRQRLGFGASSFGRSSFGGSSFGSASLRRSSFGSSEFGKKLKKVHMDAKKAMMLYHSGKAKSLKEAWAIVKGVKKPRKTKKRKTAKRN